MNAVNIFAYEASVGGLEKLREEIYRRIGHNIFAPSYQTLCSHILNCIDYPNKPNVSEGEQTVLKALQQVKDIFTDHFGYWEQDFPSVSVPSEYELFLLNLLDLIKLPGIEYKRLDTLVKEDLSKRNQTIQKYLRERYIQNYKNNAEQPRNQEERTLLAFYTRNIEEQQIIVDYLVNGVKRKSIEMSTSYYDAFGWVTNLGERPYLTASPISEKYFDHEQIDRVSHRLLDISIVEGKELKELYNTDRPEFYRRLFTVAPATEVIEVIKFYLQTLAPLTDNRRSLFEEMFELYNTGKFYGFYGLALGQVEGLFSEMVAKKYPQLNKSSLPDKVRALRSGQSNHYLALDYYEYFIPLQRNKFMHAGIDDEIEIKAHDLLLDLANVLSIYASLDAPIVVLTQMIKKRIPDEFIDVEGFNKFFELIDLSTRHKDFTSLKVEIDDFEKNFLIRRLEDAGILTDLENHIPETLKHLTDTVKLHTSYEGALPVNLDQWTNHLINTQKKKLIERLSLFYDVHYDILQKLLSCLTFLSQSSKNMPSMDRLTKDKIQKLKRDHEDDLKKIALITKIMEEAKSKLV
ncbi:hypothetical protein SAMN05444410_10848 [Hydrobacter penzbergensis]|uniref:Uncharacterized protein n=1 Tax=Hydrobacter penzbergensis TaxID=1235997 RepID=A0A8X8ICW0_9BACT|nr:hypothetical protein [Hydrobacter penzbergensis]SDX01840.1 hypothetical protein SAMN05444410_10848 [Hydrobacter penzbergensis]